MLFVEADFSDPIVYISVGETTFVSEAGWIGDRRSRSPSTRIAGFRLVLLFERWLLRSVVSNGRIKLAWIECSAKRERELECPPRITTCSLQDNVVSRHGGLRH